MKNIKYYYNFVDEKLSIFFIVLMSITNGFAQTDTLRCSSIHHQLEFNIAPGLLFQTTDFFKGVNSNGKPMDKSISYHLKYGFRFPEDSYFGRLYPKTYQGIGISLFDFYNYTDLGRPVSVYLYQGSSIFTLNKSLSLDYEWNFGLSFGWKKYDYNHNPYNTVVGSRLNAYINLGFYLNYQLSSNLKFKLGGDMTHFSNGNTKYPNGGVNSVSLRGGMTYCFDTNYSKSSSSNIPVATFKPYWNYDLMIYGATRFKGIPDENYLVPGKFAIVGMNFSPMYNFSKYFRAGVSVDLDYDESANLENHIAGTNDDHHYTFYRQPFSERFAVGLSARAEFVMPIFSINFGLGNDILYHADSTRGFYQMLALKTSITRNVYINIGYQLSQFHLPKNLMIGLGYRFYNKKEPKKALPDILR